MLRVETSARVPPVLAPVRLKSSMDIPGARSPTLRPNCFVSGTIGHFFGDDGVPHGYDLVDEAAMQTLAMSSQSALAGRFAPPGGEVPLALFPPQALLPAFFDAPLRIEVVGVVGAPLPVHLALEPSNGLGIGCQLGRDATPGAWSARAGDDGNRGGS